MMLKAGQFQVASNVRDGNGVAKIRGGMSAALGTILASGEYRGSFQANISGTRYVFVAVYDQTRTRLYYSSSTLATWTELTASSGPFGNTRLTGNAMVSFVVTPNIMAAPDGTGNQRIMFTDGTGAVREVVFSPPQGGLTGPLVASIASIAPMSVGDLPVRVLTAEFSFLNLQGTPSFTTPDNTKVDFASTGSAPNKQARLTLKAVGIAAGTTNANASVTVGSGSSVAVTTGGRQLLLGIDTSYQMLWDKIKVECASNVLWDPSSPSTSSHPIPIPLDSSNKTLWVFQYPQVTAAGAISGELKFTWVGAANEAPSADVTADIFLVAMTYGTDAHADWSIAATLANTTTLIESPGVIYSQYATQRISDLGGPILNGLKLPRSPILKAMFYAKIKNPSITERDAGVDAVNFYYKPPGAKRYRYWDQRTISSVSGSTWTLDASSSAYQIRDLRAAPFSDFYSLPEIYLPDAYHIPPPASKCLLFANDRLFAGGASGSKSNLFISEYRNPYRMRSFTAYEQGQVDADAPITTSVGPGTFQAIVPMASSTLGADTIFLFLDDGVFVTGGNISSQLQQVSRVSEFGTISPDSIRVLNGQVFYLDTEMQLRVMRGGRIDSITKDLVDDLLAAIPTARRDNVTSAVFGDRYYIFFSESGGTTNTIGLVYESIAGTWVKDVPPKTIEGLMSWNNGTGKRLIAFALDSTTLKAYEYDLDSQSQDLGTTNITATLTTREITTPDSEKWFVFLRNGILCDDITSGTASYTRSYKPIGASGTSSTSVDVSSGKALRYDGEQSITGGDGNGYTGWMSLSIAGTAGATIYEWFTEVAERNRPPEVA